MPETNSYYSGTGQQLVRYRVNNFLEGARIE
jgi:hypothetical protein